MDGKEKDGDKEDEKKMGKRKEKKMMGKNEWVEEDGEAKEHLNESWKIRKEGRKK